VRLAYVQLLESKVHCFCLGFKFGPSPLQVSLESQNLAIDSGARLDTSINDLEDTLNCRLVMLLLRFVIVDSLCQHWWIGMLGPIVELIAKLGDASLDGLTHLESLATRLAEH
jgi:hypothetical protein